MTIAELYWLTRLPGINGTLCFLSAVGIVLSLMAIVIYTINVLDSDLEPLPAEFRRFLWILHSATMLLTLAQMFIPDREDLAIIVAGSYVTSDEEISKLPANTAKALNKFLESLTDEATPETKP
jgi:hypothetical protein